MVCGSFVGETTCYICCVPLQILVNHTISVPFIPMIQMSTLVDRPEPRNGYLGVYIMFRASCLFLISILHSFTHDAWRDVAIPYIKAYKAGKTSPVVSVGLSSCYCLASPFLIYHPSPDRRTRLLLSPQP